MASAQFWPSSSPSPPSQQSSSHSPSQQISSTTTYTQISQNGFSKQTPIANQLSNQTLLQLQREIKEEEDEIFADIDSILNGRTLHLDYDDEDDEDLHDESSSFNHDSKNHKITSSDDDRDLIRRLSVDYSNGRHSGEDEYSVTQLTNGNQYDTKLSDENDNVKLSDENENPNQTTDEYTILTDEYENSTFLSDENERPVRIKDHEEDVDEGMTMMQNDDYYNNDEQFHAILKQVASSLPKPCVFFLEGNCRRSDCKFSHDLSSIPCKYWIENACFKGELCPFSHDFANLVDAQDPNNPALFDENGRPLSPLSASKREQQLNPTFVIDSEADFPSLPLDAPISSINDKLKSDTRNQDAIANTIRNQILSSNAAVVFKTVKRKRRKG